MTIRHTFQRAKSFVWINFAATCIAGVLLSDVFGWKIAVAVCLLVLVVRPKFHGMKVYSEEV